jgi:CheY-like chemotaxis protein
MTNEPAQAILLVDDEPLILTTLRIHLRHVLGAEVSLLCASSGAEAIELVDEHLAHGGEIALTIVDYQMHPMKATNSSNCSTSAFRMREK